MTTPTLKPCPFCGGKAELHVKTQWDGTSYSENYVQCVDCEAESGHYIESDASVGHWNTRAPEAPPSESAVDALAGMLEAIFKSNPDNSFAQRELALISQQMLRLRGYHLTPIAAQPDMAEQATIADYEDCLADHRRLAREIDVAMHGEEGAAKQASLCDLIEPVKKMAERVRVLEAATERMKALCRCPKADKTCVKPGITLMEACIDEALAGGKEGA